MCVIALASAALALGACGASKPAPAPGSPEKPLVAQAPKGTGTASRSNEGAGSADGRSAGATKPGYQELVQGQSRHPRTRFTPCNLVTAAQARAIVGAPMRAPLEATQGPTCVYRSRDGKTFVTVAVQSLDFAKLKRKMRQRERVEVSSRTGYCGVYGQPGLYVPLSGGRVLAVAAPCAVAKRFAARAVRQLSA